MVITPKGYIRGKIKHKTGLIENISFHNQVLTVGKELLANTLLGPSNVYITNILFGDGGTDAGKPREVLPVQDKLYGVVRLRKPVVAQIDPENSTQVIFTVVISEEECNNFTINEMGLELSDETLFSLSTFHDFTKTDQMEITWSWHVNMV